MRFRLKCLVGCVAALLAIGCTSPTARGGVVFMYHHVDDRTPASTSIAPDAFAEQLDLLERDDFTVLPLMVLLDAIAAGRPTPERSVAITFDDGYRSILTEALPLLESRGWPFTVFVNTEAIDRGYGGYLTWDELRELGERGASIGNHSVTHAHLVRRLEGETDSEWRRRVEAEIASANERLETEVPEYLIPAFAYPYGEYTIDLTAIVEGQELFGLGQHSGAIGPVSDLLALPRYPVATGLTIADFSLRARSRPLPVRVVGTERHIVARSDEPPTLHLALDSTDDLRRDELACYVSGQGRARVDWQDDAMLEFVVRPDEPLRVGRSKVNCTAPSGSDAGVYYWFGYLWMQPHPDGRWYDE